MVAFEVWHNGVKLCTAGVGGDGLLLAMLTWAGTVSSPETLDVEEEGELDVSGHSDSGRRHVEWTRKALQPGDEVLVRVVQVSEVDAAPFRK